MAAQKDKFLFEIYIYILNLTLRSLQTNVVERSNDLIHSTRAHCILIYHLICNVVHYAVVVVVQGEEDN